MRAKHLAFIVHQLFQLHCSDACVDFFIFHYL